MAMYASKDTVIHFDDSTGTPVDVSAFITKISGVEVQASIEDTSSFGSTWQSQLASGVNKLADITLDGFYEDSVGGPDAIFNATGNTTTRTLKVTYGSTKSTQVETVIKSYKRMPDMNKLTKFTVVLSPTGTVSET